MSFTTKITAILYCFFLCLSPCSAVAADQSLTQRDWMINLVDTLGYSFGLPDTPQDDDYIKLLEGTRTYRFEAEDCRNPEDLVTVQNFSSFGEFSGAGWVSAISSPTKFRMKFLLLHTGTYRFSASVRLPGHTLTMEGQSWQIDENHPLFQRVELGEITLSAGMKELTVAMPANGSIDYIVLQSPPLAAITPLTAWNPDAPLTYADLAVTTLRSLELQNLLPLQAESIMIEAEKSSVEKSFITDQRQLGEPHGGLWIRAGAFGGEISLPFTIETGAVYTFSLIAAGATPLSGNLDTRTPWVTVFPPYLKEESIGTWFLPPGPHELKVELPSRGGVDLLTLLKRRSSSEDYRILAGLPAHDTVQANEVNRLLTLLSRLHTRD